MEKKHFKYRYGSLIGKRLEKDPLHRILISWSMNFIYRSSYILLWSILVALVIEKSGMRFVPHILLLNAIFAMVASIIYAELIKAVKRQYLSVVIVILASSITIVGANLLHNNLLVSVLLISMVIGLLLNQLGILLQLQIEEKFTPAESEHAFPIVETAEIIGVAIAGFMLSKLSHGMASEKFILIFSILILLILPLILLDTKLQEKTEKITKNQHLKANVIKIKSLEKIENTFKYVMKNRFIKFIVAILICQYIMLNIVEFQFVNSIEQSVMQKSSINISEDITATIGKMLMIVSVFTLLTHLFLVEYVIKKMGVVGSMLIHPLLIVINAITMLIRFHLGTALITKTGFEMTRAIYQNAYLTSYYSLKEEVRDEVKEFLEGIIVPLGAILGTTCIIIIRKTDKFINTDTATTVILLLASLYTIWLCVRLEGEHMKQNKNLFQNAKSTAEKIEALELILQNKNSDTLTLLIQIAKNPHEQQTVRCKAIESLHEYNDQKVLYTLTDLITEKNEDIIKSAMMTLKQKYTPNAHS